MQTLTDTKNWLVTIIDWRQKLGWSQKHWLYQKNWLVLTGAKRTVNAKKTGWNIG